MTRKISLVATVAAAIVAVMLGMVAVASSPDSWDKFRAQLVQACIAKAKLPKPQILVAPEGTASYGVALLSSEEIAGQKPQSVVCVARKTPEGLVDVEVTPPAGDWIAVK